MYQDDMSLWNEEKSVPWEGQRERNVSESLTLRWSRKRKRWETDHAFFWQDPKTKWSCRSEDGKYYHGFRSFRALLKSYVGGILCEKLCFCSIRDVRARYWFSQHPKHVTCRITAHCTSLLPEPVC